MNTKTLSELEDKYVGKQGTPERDAYEKELSDLMIELAERINKKRAFISRIENDGSNLTIKTLRDIVERGLGGKLNIEVQF